jgi:hypothetical protein
MSDVYRAVDERSGSAVAVKVIRSTDSDLAQRLSREIRVHEQFDHPGLVRLLDGGFADGQAYLVMELVEGPALTAVLRRGPLSPSETAELGSTIGGALAYVHRRGVVHRDVKPGNILVTASGEARLADFGIARFLDGSSVTAAGTTLGTVAYMAPEQLENRQVGPPADIWALGIVLLECLTGRRAFEGAPHEVVARRMATPVPVRGDLPVPWRLVMSGMLDHRPEHRLDGTEVSVLLTSPTFASPWQPSSTLVAGADAATVPHDLTALVPSGFVPTKALAPDVAQVGAPMPATGLRTRGRRRRRYALVGLAAAAVVVGSLIAIGTSGPSARAGAGPKTSVHRNAPSGTVSTTTAIASTTAPTSPGQAALDTLQRDVAAEVTAGTISPGTGSAITGPAEQALTDQAAGRTDLALTDLQLAVQAVSGSVDSGSLAEATGSGLEADLAALATVLGLPGAALQTAPTPTSTSTSPSPPSHHHRDGGG